MKSNLSVKKSLKLVTATAFCSVFLMNCNGSFDKPAPTGAAALASQQKAAKTAKEAVADAQQADISGSWSCDSAQSEKVYNSQCRKKESLTISNDMTGILISREEQTDASPAENSDQSGLSSLNLLCDLQQAGSLSLSNSISANDFSGQLSLSSPVLIGDSVNVSDCQDIVANLKTKPISIAIELALEAGNGNELILTTTDKKGVKTSRLYDRASAPNVNMSNLSNAMPSLPAEAAPNVVLAPQAAAQAK
jgi:hypothetical protein